MSSHSTPIIKYPRTPHLESSRLQPGDEDMCQVPYQELVGKWIVVEEKMDGANSGMSFGADGQVRLQSRGHFLLGGGRERHFDQLKAWANTHEGLFFERFGDRYLQYGEWMSAKHTVYYDRLPHFFLEFDILDIKTGEFLSTEARRHLLQGLPVVSVPVLYEGVAPKKLSTLLSLLKKSQAKSSSWRDVMKENVARQGINVQRVIDETENSDLSEGLYIKIEDSGKTTGRLKWVRPDFYQALMESESHWQTRPIVPNRLAPGVDIFSSQVMSWAEVSQVEK